VPAKPTWYRNLPHILEELRNHPLPYVDRATLEFLLGVSRRRAQQIMAPCVADRVGSNGLADRDALISRLERIAEGDDVFREIQRRRRVAEAISKPQLLVEAPTAVVNQEFAGLPDGVQLQAGRITVEFRHPQEGLEKLLALAMAISNDFDRFERMVGTDQDAT
jgi:hypothetical protein